MSAALQTELETEIRHTSDRFISWLTHDALPVWLHEGVDQRHGGFYEAIDPADVKGCSVAKRARVQPRQIYSFIEAGNLGWTGPWQKTVEAGLDWYLAHYRHPDGTFASAVQPDGTVSDETFDLYNQAFAFFAYSQAAAALPDRAESLMADARSLLTHLRSEYGHSERGFREANPDCAPLCSNPHMHLFEASQALELIDTTGPWIALTDEIANLAMDRFIDPINGGEREFFDLDWSPMPDDRGRVMEPGHQFEWCWLLARWGILRGNAKAIQMARRLYQIGESYGIDRDRQVAIMALNDDFSVRDPLARLWGQTEWIKAAVILAEHSSGPERTAYLQDILRASNALFLYLDAAPKGLWRDKLNANGEFVEEPAPASSLYHIVCAISELHRFTKEQTLGPS
ncbi:AGE family epimerase/isomerase [Roseibium algae]|uniref:AGE family epimerase/isomerase n=1 Tax=Roseibium algae TaxID=3123038 RepID=A0ABU8TPP0_9HYPH